MTPRSSNESACDKQIAESEFKKIHQSSSKDEEFQSVLKPNSDAKKDLEFDTLLESKEEQVSQSNSDSAESTLQQKEPSVIPLKEKMRASPVNMEGESQVRVEEDSGRERLKRHRVEVAGRVWIPDMWGQEGLLKDWIDCSAFDASLMNSNIMLARAALVQEGRRASSTRIRIENSCSERKQDVVIPD